MKKSTLLLMAATVFAAGSLLAQGPDLRRDRRPGSPDRPERPERVEKAPRTEMTKEWERVQAELKKKAPEKYAEIEKLQATNLFAAMEKMRELAVEQDIQLPGRRMGRERGMAGRRMRGFGEGERMHRGPREMARPGRGAGRAVVEARLKKEFGLIKISFDFSLVACAALASWVFISHLTGIREGTAIAAFAVGLFVKFFLPRLRFLRMWFYVRN